MRWTYYCQDYGAGAWLLFREAAGQEDEVYRRGHGWHPTKLLFERQHKGDIALSDLISEAAALALIAALTPPSETAQEG